MDDPTPPPKDSVPPAADPLLPQVPAAEWALSEATSWLCLGAGILVLSLTIMIPEMIRNQETAHQMRVLDLLKHREEIRLDRHKNVLLALTHDDPALLEHLALTQLRLKPVGTQPLTPPAPDPAGNATSVEALQNYVAGRASVGAVENWLNPVLPPAETLVPKYRQPPTRLVQWASTPPYRDLALFLGLILVVLGVWPKRRTA